MNLEHFLSRPLNEFEAYAAAQLLLRSGLGEQLKFLKAFHQHTYTAPEIVGFTKALRQPIEYTGLAMGIGGTGGDYKNTFNISTCTAFVVAACGVPVTKYGNYKVTSSSGSSDALDCLHINHTPTAEQAVQCLQETGLVFLSASKNPAFERLMWARLTLKQPTIINVAGPLTNPLAHYATMIGVYNEDLVKPMGIAASMLGYDRAIVVHGNGLDEVNVNGISKAAFVHEGVRNHIFISAKKLGMSPCSLEDISILEDYSSAYHIKCVLEGDYGSRRNIVLLNAGVALYTYGSTQSIAEGIDTARHAIDSGKAYAKLAELQVYSKRFK